MTIVNMTTKDYGAGNFGVVRRKLDQRVTLARYINCATYNLDSGTFYEIFKYPANTLLQKVYTITETVEGAGDTLDIVSTDAGADTLVSNHDVNTDNSVGESSTHVFKAAAGEICIKPDADLTVCKFWVVVEYLTLSTNM